MSGRSIVAAMLLAGAMGGAASLSYAGGTASTVGTPASTFAAGNVSGFRAVADPGSSVAPPGESGLGLSSTDLSRAFAGIRDGSPAEPQLGGETEFGSGSWRAAPGEIPFRIGQTGRIPLRLGQRGPMSSTVPASGAATSKNLRAIGLSLLLPGLAQLEAGETTRGVAMIAAEAGIWTAFTVFRVQGARREDSYIEMASLFAGVENAKGRSDDYYKRIGTSLSSDAYDELTRRDARTLYGDDLEAREVYFEQNRVPPDQAWQWESYAALQRYQEKRSDAQLSFKRSRNMIGLAAVNRVVAMIDAVLLGDREDGGSTTRVEFRPGWDGGADLGRLCLTRTLP